MTAIDEPLHTTEDVARVIAHLVRDYHERTGEGLLEDDLEAMTAVVLEWTESAALLRLWREGKMILGPSTDPDDPSNVRMIAR